MNIVLTHNASKELIKTEENAVFQIHNFQNDLKVSFQTEETFCKDFVFESSKVICVQFTSQFNITACFAALWLKFYVPRKCLLAIFSSVIY